MLQLLKYCVLLIIRPLTTTTQIVRERNTKTAYYAIWLALVTFIINAVLTMEKTPDLLTKASMNKQTVHIAMLVITFFFVPIAFFVGRLIFVSLTKGGIRLLKSKKYPKDQHDRAHASKTLYMIFPYIYIPMTIVLLITLLSGNSLPMPLESTLRLIASIYSIILQVAFIRRIYPVSKLVAFFAPNILFIVTGIVLFLILAFTTGIVGVLSHYT